MIRRPPRSTLSPSSAASDVYKRQVLVLNHIHLFGVATPLLYVYFILNFSYNYPRWASMLWAFIMGIIIDIFSNTPGIASASLTLLAAIQPHILRPFIMHDDTSDIEPNITVLTYSRYICLLYTSPSPRDRG